MDTNAIYTICVQSGQYVTYKKVKGLSFRADLQVNWNEMYIE